MWQKITENKWTIIAIVLVAIAIYYFYYQNYGEK